MEFLEEWKHEPLDRSRLFRFILHRWNAVANGWPNSPPTAPMQGVQVTTYLTEKNLKEWDAAKFPCLPFKKFNEPDADDD